MLRTLICLVLATIPPACALSPRAFADTWTSDRNHSEVRFSWDHLGLARQSGEFTDVRATLDFTPTAPEEGTVSVAIRAASLWTGVKELDDLLRGPDFFAAARHPEITFASKAVRRTGDKAGEIEGELTMLGVTKRVVLATTWNFTGEHPLGAINPAYKGRWVSGFSAEATIARSDFGLSRAIPLVSDEIRIVIEMEFLRKD